MAHLYSNHIVQNRRLVPQIWRRLLSDPLVGKVSKFITGFLVGFSISVGLGFTLVHATVFGILVGIGVLVSGSLVAFLTIQSLVIGLLTGIVYVLIRVMPLVIEPEVFQIVFMSLVLFSPLITLHRSVRIPLSKLEVGKTVELISAIFFSALVQILRGRMPADGLYALSQMYENEDNAGIIDVLSHSIHFGISSTASALGEYTNSLYISAAGFTSWFGIPSNQDLISPLTHWNMMLLLMSWAPITSMIMLAFSGKRPSSTVSILSIFFMSLIFIFILWPFTSIGHTAVISSGMFAATFLAITLNTALIREHPFVFALILTEIGFVVGNIWFPLFPFTAAVVGFSFLLLLRNEYRKRNTPVVIGLILFFGVVGYNLMPAVLELVSANDSLLQLQGGTRSASESLILIWLFISSVTFWILTKKALKMENRENPLFLVAVATLIASNAYLFLNGILNNGGSPGYGASKYLLTTIGFALPVLWITIMIFRRIVNPLRLIGGGLALVLAILVSQPDSRPVAASFLADSQEVSTEVSQSGVFGAIKEALAKDAEQILCVADYGPPLDERSSFGAYLCTRWGQAVAVNILDSPTSQWSFVFLDRAPLESLEWVRDTYANDNVVIIRFTDPLKPLLKADTWWYEYVHPSWEVITIN